MYAENGGRFALVSRDSGQMTVVNQGERQQSSAERFQGPRIGLAAPAERLRLESKQMIK